MGKKLMSRMDVMSLSGVIYPYVFKENFNLLYLKFLHNL